MPINSEAATKVPVSMTAANMLIPLERFSLDDLIGAAFWALNGLKTFSRRLT